MKEFNYEKSLMKMRKKYKRKPYKEPLEHIFWMTREDKLYKMFEEYKDVYQQGQVYYGQLVLANPILKDDTEFLDGPAVMVYSTDEWANANPEKLVKVAAELMRYRTEPEEMIPEEIKEPIALLNEQKDRSNFRFEYMLDGHKIKMHFATILIYRKFLPTGYLTGNILPLVATEDRETVLVLPNTYWSKDFKNKFAENARVDILEEDEDFEE